MSFYIVCVTSKNVLLVFLVTSFLLNKCWSSIITIHAIFWLLVLRWIIPQSSRITFMAFAMIGANIIPAVATIREESNRKGRKNPSHWLLCIKYDLVSRNITSCSFACSQVICQSNPKTSFCEGVKSNPGSHLFPIWWDECICGWSINKSGFPGTEKWQVCTLM